MLIKELDAFGKNGSISKSSLEQIDTLAHATKNIIKILDSCENEESYGNVRDYRGRESYRDMGYSRSNDNLRGQLYNLMEMASDDRTRDELRKFIDRI